MKAFSRQCTIGLPAVGLAVLLAVGLSPAWSRDPQVPAEADPVALVKDQRALAERALGLIDRSAKIGAPVANAASDVHIWSYRRLGARLFLTFGPDERKTMEPEVYLMHATGPPNPDRIAAFEEHRAMMQSWEERFRALAERGVGSRFDYLHFQAHLLQAETWLAREKARKPVEAGVK